MLAQHRTLNRIRGGIRADWQNTRFGPDRCHRRLGGDPTRARAGNRHAACDQAGAAAADDEPAGRHPGQPGIHHLRSPLGFSIKVPEGWARRTSPAGVSFSQQIRRGGGIGGAGRRGANPRERATEPGGGRPGNSPAAVQVSKVEAVSTPAGQAVRIAYASNSAANPVTGKAIRLEDEQYLFWNNGRLATLTLSAPFGADNVDQWRLMSRSFQWH